MLILKGEKRYEKEEKGKDQHMSERAYGSFQRSFTLPDSIDRDKITGELTKGVLTIALPKSAVAQKPEKKIEINPQRSAAGGARWRVSPVTSKAI
jgi:HSP20 family protein